MNDQLERSRFQNARNRQFFGRRAHWDILMFVNVILVGITSLQLWTMWGEPGERPVNFYLFLLALFLYAFMFFWVGRASRLARKLPLLRVNSEGLGIRSPSSETFRVTPWEEVSGIAHQNDDEIGVRLSTAKDGIADVVPVPLAFRGTSSDDVRRAIESWLDAENAAAGPGLVP